MPYTKTKHTHLWNDLPLEERSRLHPYMIETHILHLEQTREKIIRHHNGTIEDINKHIDNLKQALKALDK